MSLLLGVGATPCGAQGLNAAPFPGFHHIAVGDTTLRRGAVPTPRPVALSVQASAEERTSLDIVLGGAIVVLDSIGARQLLGFVDSLGARRVRITGVLPVDARVLLGDSLPGTLSYRATSDELGVDRDLAFETSDGDRVLFVQRYGTNGTGIGPSDSLAIGPLVIRQIPNRTSIPPSHTSVHPVPLEVQIPHRPRTVMFEGEWTELSLAHVGRIQIVVTHCEVAVPVGSARELAEGAPFQLELMIVIRTHGT